LEDPQLPQADLIVNLAAVHREPGHEEHEYYDTNLPGATNICAWSEKVGCDRVIFTSSIAVYGPSPAEKDEFTAPTPTTPYGKSKLEAEQIHRRWQEKDPNHRLLIVRPGLIFGPGEGGNLTRMVKAVLGRYFFYTGNQDTRKAGGYVKELCTAIDFMMQKQNDQNEPVVLFNFTMDPPPTVKQYAQAICQAAGIKRFIPSVPLPLLLVSSYFIDRISRLFGINQPINPIRVRKATRSNNIRPTILRQAGYKYHYSLLQALTDWRHDRPEDWH
jgi:nucleoside-diphosphate-sugar epimerase